MGFKPEAALNTLQFEMVQGIENACRRDQSKRQFFLEM
jgi:hypothetical protein